MGGGKSALEILTERLHALAAEYKAIAPSQPKNAAPIASSFSQEEAAKFVALVREFEKTPTPKIGEKLQAALPEFLEKFAVAPANQQKQLQAWKEKAEAAQAQIKALLLPPEPPLFRVYIYQDPNCLGITTTQVEIYSWGTHPTNNGIPAPAPYKHGIRCYNFYQPF